eukprot:GHRQ01000766.1.p1 GENE.GHRQ01000766.1~~GHRQ01000766.1.p1  ORF type:complete len:187 (+),score=48.02 GHRQ01000766.1:61-621(+)
MPRFPGRIARPQRRAASEKALDAFTSDTWPPPHPHFQMKAQAITAVLLLAFAGVATAQNAATLTVEFDNRGSKVMDKNTNAKILKALCEKVFMTRSCQQVEMVGGMGQSNLINHKSTVVYAAVGATTNGKTVLQNCQANIKSGFLRRSELEKSLKKATDTWLPGDSVAVKNANCGSPVALGRKMAL